MERQVPELGGRVARVRIVAGFVRRKLVQQCTVASGTSGQVVSCVRRRDEQPGQHRSLDEPDRVAPPPRLEEYDGNDVVRIRRSYRNGSSMSADPIMVTVVNTAEGVSVPGGGKLHASRVAGIILSSGHTM